MSGNANPAWIERYLDSLLTQRKYSPHSVAAYRRDLIELSELAKPTALSAISHFQIRQFAAKLHANKNGSRSIARKLSAWRGFFTWLAQQTPMSANPVDGVKPPKHAGRLPKALSQDDAIRLVSSPSSTERDESAQACNRAMFELLYSSGLRVSELAALDTHYVQESGYVSHSWLNRDAAEVIVTGKGNKQRAVPVGQAALTALADWLKQRPTLPDTAVGEDRFALFLGTRQTRITPRAIQLRLKAHAQALGIPVNVHPHVLRHSFASHVLQSSGDLRAVQEMLGHSSIASTQVYTSLDFQRLAQVYDAAHPRARKKPTEPQ
ncbi:MAG: tyrosine recombinase XerC [Oxalobacter sp.]|nr:MAG: tyrosine recombinase XerC [Oxalobacter sp.]